MWNARLDITQAGIKNTRRNTNNLRYADDTTLTAESEQELKSLLMKVKVQNEKAGLKPRKTKIPASGPIPSWQRDGKKVETMTVYFLGLQNTADGDSSHEIKRLLLLGRKAVRNLDSILKIRHITLPTKVRLVKATVFPVVSCGCESCTIKWGEHWRTDGFKLWRFPVPWTARWSNQSIQKEINLEYSLNGPMLKLKLQYFGHLMWRADSLDKILMLGKIEGKRRKGHQRMRWLGSITDSMKAQ